LTYALNAAAGMLAPGLSALLVTRFLLGESWHSTTLDRLGAKRYYLWAWILAPLWVCATTALAQVTGAGSFDTALPAVRSVLAASGKSLPSIPLVEAFGLQLLIGALCGPLISLPLTMGEEVGWRGFLLPRLMAAGMSEWSALIASGAIWGAWHAPMIVRGVNFPGHPVLGPFLMIGFCIMFGIIFGWLRLASGSVWPCGVIHGSLNAVGPSIVLLLAPGFNEAGVAACLTLPILLFVGVLAWRRVLPVTSPLAPRTLSPA
jgi:membrane protease YdiL (CAAX protease family)